MTSLRILYNHRTLADGAEGVHIGEMVNAFQLLGNTVEVVCPGGHSRARGESSTDAALISRFKHLMPKCLFSLAQILYNVKSYQRVVEAIDRFCPDFLYERYACFNYGGIKAARERGLPIIVEFNTPYSIAWARYDKLYFRRTASRIERQIVDLADLVVTVSTALKQILIDQGVPGDKILVTPNAINPEYLKSVRPGTVRQQYGLQDRTVVGFVGSLRSWHGIDLLMAVIPSVLRVNPRCHFLIVGTGELADQFRNHIRRCQLETNVTFTGRVPHERVLDYVEAMDIALMPNSNEYGSPMKVFEYMAMGKATIAPRLGPLEEIITHDQTGVLVEPGNAEVLTDAICRLSFDRNLRNTLGDAAHSHVLANHTWQINAQRVLASVLSLPGTVVPS